MRLEQTILSNLIYDEEYTRRVLPFLKVDYFQDQTEKVLFEEIDSFVAKYNGLPTKDTLAH
jgi:replicative DNA helicase